MLAKKNNPHARDLDPTLTITRLIANLRCLSTIYYDTIDKGTAMTCLICKVEHFPVNYVKGDKVDTYAVCRWHLGISRCVNCGKNLVGLGVIRDHRRLCRVPPETEASP